jgi:hypothetical protein
MATSSQRSQLRPTSPSSLYQKTPQCTVGETGTVYIWHDSSCVQGPGTLCDNASASATCHTTHTNPKVAASASPACHTNPKVTASTSILCVKVYTTRHRHIIHGHLRCQCHHRTITTRRVAISMGKEVSSSLHCICCRILTLCEQ